MFERDLYSSDHEVFRDSVRKFIADKVTPFHEQWEKDGIVPKALWLKAGEAGLLSPGVPEEYGGFATGSESEKRGIGAPWTQSIQGPADGELHQSES